MRVKKIISKSDDKKRMEVIAEEGGKLKTLHLKASGKEWMYCAGKDELKIKIRDQPSPKAAAGG